MLHLGLQPTAKMFSGRHMGAAAGGFCTWIWLNFELGERSSPPSSATWRAANRGHLLIIEPFPHSRQPKFSYENNLLLKNVYIFSLSYTLLNIICLKCVIYDTYPTQRLEWTNAYFLLSGEFSPMTTAHKQLSPNIWIIYYPHSHSDWQHRFIVSQVGGGRGGDRWFFFVNVLLNL